MIFSKVSLFFRLPGGNRFAGYPGLQEIVVWLLTSHLEFIPENVSALPIHPDGGGSVAPWSLFSRYTGFHGILEPII